MNGLKNMTARAGLMAGGAILALAAGGYGQRAHAQAAGCTAVDSNITCTGDATTEQSFSSGSRNYVVTTDPTFSIDSSGNAGEDGFTIRGRTVDFNDAYGGDITGQIDGFY